MIFPLALTVQLCLPCYPGIDPQVNLYLCLNDRVYATLLFPLDLSTYTPEYGLRGTDKSFRSVGGKLKFSRVAAKAKDRAETPESWSSEEDEEFYRDSREDDLMEWFARTGVPKQVRDRYNFRRFRLVRYIPEEGIDGTSTPRDKPVSIVVPHLDLRVSLKEIFLLCILEGHMCSCRQLKAKRACPRNDGSQQALTVTGLGGSCIAS